MNHVLNINQVHTEKFLEEQNINGGKKIHGSTAITIC